MLKEQMRRHSQCVIRWAVLVVCLVILLLPAGARAAGGTGDLWQAFGVGDGLRSGNVSAVYAAPDGSLWFGTDAGVSSFDGHQWQTLGAADGLPADRVRAIAQTGDGAFWFATKTAGLARRLPGTKCCQTWSTPQGLPSNDVWALLPAAVSPDGHAEPGLWVGTAQGLVYLEGTRVLRDSPLADAPILALAAGPDDALYVSTNGRGIWQRSRAGEWRMVDGSAPPTGEVFALLVEADGRLWAGTQNGLFFYDSPSGSGQGGSWQRFPLAGLADGPVVFAVVQDRTGGLWLGTDQGLFYDADARSDAAPIASPAVPGTVQWRARSDGLVSDYVRAMAFGGDGALWLGTIAGVGRYAGPIWQVIRDDGLADQRINTILTDSAGRTWVGTERNGLAQWDGKRWQHLIASPAVPGIASPAVPGTEREGVPDQRIVSLFEDRRGRIWVGTGSDIGYLGPDGQWRFFGRPAGLAGLPVYGFEQDPDGVLWLATDGGVSRWDEAAGFSIVPELAGKRVNAVRRSRDGALWLGLPDEGLRRRPFGQSWAPVTLADGSALRGIVVGGIEESSDGSLWIGTGNDGLWQYAGGQWRRVDGTLPSPKVLAVNYSLTNLWVGTYAGLSRSDGATWQTYSGSVLPSSKVLAIAPGAAGETWIGTEAGLVRYRPAAIKPWVRIVSVNLQGPVNGAVTLNDGKLQAVQLDAGALGTRFDDLVFLVQLVGDPAERIVTEPTVFFENLALTPGSHTLRVRVRDADFNYSAPSEIVLAVALPRPEVILPGGRRVPADIFYPSLVLGLLAVGGLASAGGISWRARRREQQQAAALETHQRDALARHFNPYVCGEPVRQPDMFFGRDELLRRIFNALHQNSIMIHGERRMGKTSLLYQLAERLRETDDPEWVFIPVLVDLEGTPQTQFFYLLMEATWGVLRGYVTSPAVPGTAAPPALRFGARPAAEYNDRDFTADLRLLLEGLKDLVAPRNMRVILLMDEMDVISSYDTLVQQQLRRIFMSSLAGNLGAVVAGVQISKAWDRMESPWYNLFNEIALEPFDRVAALELLMEPVQGTYTWEPAALEFVLAQAEGRPFRLQQYGLEAVNQMLAAERARITLADVQDAHQAIERSRTE